MNMVFEGFFLVSVKSCPWSSRVICLANNLKDGWIMEFPIIWGYDVHEVIEFLQVVIIGKVALLERYRFNLALYRAKGRNFWSSKWWTTILIRTRRAISSWLLQTLAQVVCCLSLVWIRFMHCPSTREYKDWILALRMVSCLMSASNLLLNSHWSSCSATVRLFALVGAVGAVRQGMVYLALVTIDAHMSPPFLNMAPMCSDSFSK